MTAAPQPAGDDLRERVARHLFDKRQAASAYPMAWDRLSEFGRENIFREADEILALLPAPPALVEVAILRGVGKINGDGWKDVTQEGEVVFVWNAEKPAPYGPGQYPRIGNEGWSASTRQYDFSPATADDVPAILAALQAMPASGGEWESLDDAAERQFLKQYPDRDFYALKDMVKISWMRSAWNDRALSQPAPPALGEVDRASLIAMIMEETTDDVMADGWQSLGKPNVLVQGCRFVRRYPQNSTDGYANPKEAAERFAGFIADRILAALQARPPASVGGGEMMLDALSEAEFRVIYAMRNEAETDFAVIQEAMLSAFDRENNEPDYAVFQQQVADAAKSLNAIWKQRAALAPARRVEQEAIARLRDIAETCEGSEDVMLAASVANEHAADLRSVLAALHQDAGDAG